MVWPTARMRKREEMIFRARRREALLVREEFETKMTNLVQAKAMEGLLEGVVGLEGSTSITLPTISMGL